MSHAVSHAVHRPPRTIRRTRRAFALEQAAVAGGQVLAGVGNLAFALVLAHVLAPGAFADTAAFLALYLVVHMPLASLSAGAALRPDAARRARLRLAAGGTAAGAALALASGPAAALLGLPQSLIMALAASVPGAGLLALERGRLHGLTRNRQAVASLLAEPVVRIGAGLALLPVFGPAGAAAAVVAAGYAALAVAALDRRSPAAAPEPVAGGRSAGVAVAAFALLALLQTQDLLIANAVLAAGEAGRFAVISTIGGAAAFATTTVPLVLLPRARDGEPRALGAAIAVAAALGAAATAVVAAAPPEVVAALFGERYAGVRTLAVPYTAAMALLGVTRVLVADACAGHRSVLTVLLLSLAVAGHAALVVLLGGDLEGVVGATLAAHIALAAFAGAGALLRLHPGTVRAPMALPGAGMLRLALPWTAVASLTLAGVALRLLAHRGIWLDEAISVHQAQLPLGAMLEQLREGDVHPPLHHLVLWLFVRVLGTGELAVRVPSLVAGAALVPLLYAAGRDIYDRRAGLAAAALGTVAPFAVWYAQEARMYALFMLLALVALWMQARVLRGGGGTGSWAAYALATAGLLWNHYFAVFFVAAQQATFAAVAWRRWRRGEPVRPLLAGWSGSGAAIAVALAPLVPFAHDQFAANEDAGRGFRHVPSQAGASVAEGGQGPSVYGAITNLVWTLWGYHSDETMRRIGALWPLGMLGALLLLGRGRSRATHLFAAAAVVPAVVLFGVGHAKPFVFEARYFIGAVPALLLLAGRALTSWTRTTATALAATAAGTATLGVALADQQLNGANPRVYDFKGAVRDIAARARPGDVVVYAPGYLAHVVDYYGDGLDARPLDDGMPRRARRVFLLASFLDKPHHAARTGQAVAELRQRRDLVRKTQRPQIRTWEFR